MNFNEDDEVDPLTHVVYVQEDGTEHIAPRADSFVEAPCGDPHCPLIHIISLTDDDTPLCETSFNREQLLQMLHSKGPVGHA